MSVNERIKKYIKETAVFKYYRQGELIYEIITEDDEVFMFPVPISDTGTGIFKAADKAVFFMRWIRKQLEAIVEEQGG